MSYYIRPLPNIARSFRMLHEQECLINQMNEAYLEFDEDLLKLRSDKIQLDVEVHFAELIKLSVDNT